MKRMALAYLRDGSYDAALASVTLLFDDKLASKRDVADIMKLIDKLDPHKS